MCGVWAFLWSSWLSANFLILNAKLISRFFPKFFRPILPSYRTMERILHTFAVSSKIGTHSDLFDQFHINEGFFVQSLQKDYHKRPKYHQLMVMKMIFKGLIAQRDCLLISSFCTRFQCHPFILKYEREEVDVEKWFLSSILWWLITCSDAHSPSSLLPRLSNRVEFITYFAFSVHFIFWWFRGQLLIVYFVTSTNGMVEDWNYFSLCK